VATSEPFPNFNRFAAVRRALLTFVAAISFLLLLAVLYLWVRSHFIAEVIYFRPTTAPEEFASPMPNKPGRWEFQWNLASSAGKAQVVRRNIGMSEGREAKTWHLRPDDPASLTTLSPRDPLDVDWRIAGIQYFRSDRRYFTSGQMRAWVWGFMIVTVPYWLLAVATAIPPAFMTARFLRHSNRRRRIKAGLCPNCGYDLRATPGACPECGSSP
jgi:hypothetical protein